LDDGVDGTPPVDCQRGVFVGGIRPCEVAGVDFVDVMAPPGVVSFARSGAERTRLR
jgi:hypothetical protein